MFVCRSIKKVFSIFVILFLCFMINRQFNLCTFNRENLLSSAIQYLDLRHWKIAEIEMVKPIMGIKYVGTEYEEEHALNDGYSGGYDSQGFLIIEPAANRFFVTPKHYYYSIPLDELFLNPNLGPNNPGW